MRSFWIRVGSNVMCSCKNIGTQTQDNMEGQTHCEEMGGSWRDLCIYKPGVLRLAGSWQKLGERHRMDSLLVFNSH